MSKGLSAAVCLSVALSPAAAGQVPAARAAGVAPSTSTPASALGAAADLSARSPSAAPQLQRAREIAESGGRPAGSAGGIAEGKTLEMLLWGCGGAVVGSIAGPLGAAVGGAVGAAAGLVVGIVMLRKLKNPHFRDSKRDAPRR